MMELGPVVWIVLTTGAYNFPGHWPTEKECQIAAIEEINKWAPSNRSPWKCIQMQMYKPNEKTAEQLEMQKPKKEETLWSAFGCGLKLFFKAPCE